MSFEFAEKQKINVSELLNQIVAKHFKRHLAATMQANQRAFESQFGSSRSSSRKTSVLTNRRSSLSKKSHQ